MAAPRRLFRVLGAAFRAAGLVPFLASAPLGPVAAQTTGGVIQSRILTIDSERLYRDSRFGKRVARETAAAADAVQAENERIERELEAEEQALTDQRADLDPEAFRPLADAFDEKVRRIRAEREAESRALTRGLEEARRAFLQASVPVIEDLMRQAGAVVVLEQRDIFISTLAIDITDLAIQRVDARLGDGQGQGD